MPESKIQKGAAFIGWLSALLASFSAIITFVGWLMMPHVETFIMKVVDKNKGRSTKELLAEEMSTKGDRVEKDDVCEELGQMYIEMKTRHYAEDTLLQRWIPFLIEENKWTNVGYFVKKDDPETTVFRHWNGRSYSAWKDEQGWFYVRGGHKYYR